MAKPIITTVEHVYQNDEVSEEFESHFINYVTEVSRDNGHVIHTRITEHSFYSSLQGPSSLFMDERRIHNRIEFKDGSGHDNLKEFGTVLFDDNVHDNVPPVETTYRDNLHYTFGIDL